LSIEGVVTKGECQSQLQLIQIVAIYLAEYSTKNPNHNTQISNNIKITNSNVQDMTNTYWMSPGFICLEFRFLSFHNSDEIEK
jgi:hypothetical protein